MANYNVKEIKERLQNLDSAVNKLGELIYDEISSIDNTTKEIGKGVFHVITACKTEDELKIADNMLIALCGWSICTILENIEKRDSQGYLWESIL